MEEIMSTSTPMVNETNMRNYINKYVILHGKVNSIKNNTLFLTLNQGIYIVIFRNKP